jgi:hypothetical protein
MNSPKYRLTIDQVRAALAELDKLSRSEYGLELQTLLLDKGSQSAVRLQRLTGIALKQPFAQREEAKQPGVTQARYAWPGRESDPDASAAPEAFALLDELRRPGPWRERSPYPPNDDPQAPITWKDLKEDAEHERGLFKVVALYAADKVNGRDGKTLREYYRAEESRKLESALDLAVVVSDFAVTGPIAAAVGVPTVAVGLALIAVQFGYRLLTDPNADRQGDQFR